MSKSNEKHSIMIGGKFIKIDAPDYHVATSIRRAYGFSLTGDFIREELKEKPYEMDIQLEVDEDGKMLDILINGKSATTTAGFV